MFGDKKDFDANVEILKAERKAGEEAVRKRKDVDLVMRSKAEEDAVLSQLKAKKETHSTPSPSMAGALGLSEAQICALDASQLRMLAVELGHGDAPGVVDTEMERLAELCNNHHWSPDSDLGVFNPFTVHNVMAKGKLETFWSGMGETSLLFRPNLLSKSLLDAAANNNGGLPATTTTLRGRLSANATSGNVELSQDEQLAVLVSSGALTIAPRRTAGDNSLRLVVPNHEARAEIWRVLTSAGSHLAALDILAVKSLVNAGKFIEVVEKLQPFFGRELERRRDPANHVPPKLQDFSEADVSSMLWSWLTLTDGAYVPEAGVVKTVNAATGSAGVESVRDVATEAAAVKQGRADHALLLPICTRVLEIKVVQLTATRTSIVKGLKDAIRQVAAYQALGGDDDHVPCRHRGRRRSLSRRDP